MNIPSSIDHELLKSICLTPGAPGYEHQIRDLVRKELEGLVDEVSEDNMGNLYAVKKGKSSKKLMLAAHLDEIGFMITHIDDQGFARFTPLGGFDPKTLTAQKVWVHGKEQSIMGVMGAKPIHVMSPEERTKAPKITDYFIDFGLSADEANALIHVGSTVTRHGEYHRLGRHINTKSLDNRISVYIQLEVLKALQGITPEVEVHAVFTVQEEVGIRGADVATQKVQPDLAICLDTTIAFDVPGSQPHDKVTELGKGTAIKVMDSRTICDPRMITYLERTAEEANIVTQKEILIGGGTDTSAMQRMTAGGSLAGALSIPTRHIHQVIEMCHEQDVLGTISLLSHAVNNMGTSGLI